MNIPEEQFELIVKYVDAELHEAEHDSFNELMLSSEPFRKELMEVEMIVASIKAIGHRRNVERVKNIIQQLDEDKRKKKRYRLRPPLKWSIAASVSLVVILSFLGINRSISTGSDSIYDIYFEPYPTGRLFRNDTKVSEGLELYWSGQYRKAIPVLEAELSQKRDFELLELYIANSYMMSGRFIEAEKILKSTKVSQAETLTDQYILWYLGLSLVQLGKNAEAVVLFRKLSNEGGIYEREAREILDLLE